MRKLRQRRPRQVNEEHLEKVRQLPCYVARQECFGTVASHHVKTKGAGGSDRQAVPLCVTHHSECHQRGRKTFASRYGFDWEAAVRETNERIA